MLPLNRKTANIQAAYPERILQFGGGNFLRAFTDWMLDVYNDKTDAQLGILVVKSRPGSGYDSWKVQEGLFHVLTRGFQGGSIIEEKHLIKSVSRILHLYDEWTDYLKSAENPDLRFIISNTTEAGIRFSASDQLTDQPPNEFPAKLTLWLYHRYQYFQGNRDKACILIPTELILNNGDALCACILQNADNWGLESGFKQWVEEANIFCNTLVDRIVPGIDKTVLAAEQENIGFKDTMMTQGEAFHFMAIEGPTEVQAVLPLDKVGLNVVFTEDLEPYRMRKVRILNGAHTSMVPVGYLYGIETVREAVEHEVMGRFVQSCIFEEIIPPLDLPAEALDAFANDVLDRFKNPFIQHHLISISLNSISKFKTRVLPSILAYQRRKGTLPTALVFSFAALIRFYKGSYQGKAIPLKDDPVTVTFIQELWAICDGSEAGIRLLVEKVLAWQEAWGQDLCQVLGLLERLTGHLLSIEEIGMKKTLEGVIRG